MTKSVLSITLLLLMMVTLPVRAIPPGIYCDVTHIDELAGTPLQSVARVMTDADGYLWLATWNGLHRYDGRRLAKIPMRMRRGDMPTSERFYNLQSSGSGNIWCVIDDRLMYFDTRTYVYSDINADLEAKFNIPVKVKLIIPTDDHRLIIETTDGKWIIIGPDETAASATISTTKPSYRRARPLRPYSKPAVDATGADDYIYSSSSAGIDIVITRDGNVIAGHTGLADHAVLGHIPTGGKPLTFQDTDIDNNIWVRTAGNLFKVNVGPADYTPLPVSVPDKVRATMRDSRGRLWLAESDGAALGLYTPQGTLTGYLDSSGAISTSYRLFGHKIYSLAEYPEGTFWVGTKPDGIFRFTSTAGDRLTPAGNSASPTSVYDIRPDRYGRLWLASIDEGIACIPAPSATPVSVVSLSDPAGYPAEAIRARHISPTRDSLYAATTAGLVISPLPQPGSSLTLHPTLIKADGLPGTPGGVAVSDVLPTAGGIVLATESSGIDIGRGTPLFFKPLPDVSGTRADVTQSLTRGPTDTLTTVVGDNLIYIFNPSAPTPRLLRTGIDREKIRFTEPRPIYLTDSTLLLAHTRGALILNLRLNDAAEPLPLVFTSVSIQNRPDSIIAASTDTLLMRSDERNLTLHFAALEFNRPGALDYSFKIDDNAWTPLGNTNSLTFLDLDPGTHIVSIRSTYPDGSLADNVRSITIIVEPRFSETLTARILLLLLIAAIICTCVYVYVYIRRIKRRQHETLEAYLQLLGRDTDTAPARPVDQRQPPRQPAVNAADDDMMNLIVKFVDDHLNDSEITVDDMAAALSTSRSSLTRKMRSLLGVTPAEFIRQSRLERAAAMLVAGDIPVKNIAVDCGFSDLNYFSKCFKSRFGMTPTAYRRSRPSPQ